MGINNAKFKDKFIAPLRNLRCNVPSICLSGEYIIRNINDHERNHLNYLREKAHFMPIGVNEYILEVPVEQEIEKNFSGEEAIRNNKKGAEAIEDGIKILRLFKSGLIGFDCILKALADNSAPAYTSFYSHRYLTRITGEFKLYELTESKEINSLTEFWSKYIDFIKTENKALHWFYRSYHEFYSDDRLLDLVFTLENLYLKGDSEKQSLRYKFAIRGAFFLEKEPLKRKEIFAFLSEVYNLRNKIVHGDNVPDYDSLDILPKLEDIVRKSLHNTLMDSKYYKNLDNNIF